MWDDLGGGSVQSGDKTPQNGYLWLRAEKWGTGGKLPCLDGAGAEALVDVAQQALDQVLGLWAQRHLRRKPQVVPPQRRARYTLNPFQASYVGFKSWNQQLKPTAETKRFQTGFNLHHQQVEIESKV